MLEVGDPYQAHVFSRVPREIAEAETMTLATYLRHMVAGKFADMEPEQFLNEMRTFAMCDQQVRGNWKDGWSPVEMLDRNNFAFLNNQNIDVVVGVENCDEGNADDYKVGLRMSDGSYEYFVVDQCRSNMFALLKRFARDISKYGRHAVGY